MYALGPGISILDEDRCWFRTPDGVQVFPHNLRYEVSRPLQPVYHSTMETKHLAWCGDANFSRVAACAGINLCRKVPQSSSSTTWQLMSCTHAFTALLVPLLSCMCHALADLSITFDISNQLRQHFPGGMSQFKGSALCHP